MRSLEDEIQELEREIKEEENRKDFEALRKTLRKKNSKEYDTISSDLNEWRDVSDPDVDWKRVVKELHEVYEASISKNIEEKEKGEHNMKRKRLRIKR